MKLHNMRYSRNATVKNVLITITQVSATEQEMVELIEIEEVVPYYICNKSRYCNKSEGCGGDMCHHTISSTFAQNQDSIALLEEFKRRFHVVVDDYGRLICTEREETDELNT